MEQKMNVNVYLEDLLTYHKIKKWPKSILKFKGCRDFPSFEAARKDLLQAKDDPLKDLNFGGFPT